MKATRINQKGFGALEIIAIIVVVGLVGFLGWTAYSRFKPKATNSTTAQQNTILAQPNTETPTIQATQPASVNPYEGWKTYTSPLPSGLSFKYPADWHFSGSSSTTPTPNIYGGVENFIMVFSSQPKYEGYVNVVNQYMCVTVDEYSVDGWKSPNKHTFGEELSSEKYSIGTTNVTLSTFAGDTPMQSEMILHTPDNSNGDYFVSTKNNYTVRVSAGFNRCQQSDGGITDKQADFYKQPETATAKMIIKSIQF